MRCDCVSPSAKVKCSKEATVVKDGKHLCDHCAEGHKFWNKRDKSPSAVAV